MERLAYAKLLKWKDSDRRKPLIVRGVRQCGKTYLIKKFAKENYSDFAYFKFEGDSKLSKIFEVDLDVRRVINELSYIRKKKITENTLVFFDEIQFCGAALTSMKYFAEELPNIHVICAGSLLGVKLAERKSKLEKYSFPVGKVNYLTLYPMNFLEFVLAIEGEMLFDMLNTSKPSEELPEAVLQKSKTLYREYCAIGGMPEAVESWAKHRDMCEVEEIHKELLMSYESDCVKYAPNVDVPRILSIWRSIPAQMSKENRRFMFGQAVEGARYEQLKDALQWLISSGLVHKIPKVEKPLMPLSETMDNNMFKLYYCDIGLLRTMSNIQADSIIVHDDYAMKGAMGENYVLNEMISSSSDENGFFYWTNPKGMAEIDFVTTLNGKCVPIEVKTGNVKRLSSMEFYLEKYNPEVAVLTSWKNVRDGQLRFIPLCIISRIKEFTE